MKILVSTDTSCLVNNEMLKKYEISVFPLNVIIDGEEYQIDSLGFREAIVFPEVPVKEGYTFGGWSEAPATMPMSDVTVEGTFVVNKYAVNYVVDGSVYKTDSVAYGDIINLPESLVKEGYTFSGWSEIPETMPAHDVTVTGSFEVDGIETIITSNLVDVYTLQGVIVKSRIPVETLREELSTGIYIVNGKKFVVK